MEPVTTRPKGKRGIWDVGPVVYSSRQSRQEHLSERWNEIKRSVKNNPAWKNGKAQKKKAKRFLKRHPFSSMVSSLAIGLGMGTVLGWTLCKWNRRPQEGQGIYFG